MQRQQTAITLPRILCSAALHSLLAVQLFSQTPVKEGAEFDLTFDEVKTSSRKNPLDLFKLNKLQNAQVSRQQQAASSTEVATKLTSIPQPPAAQPPAPQPPAAQPPVIGGSTESSTIDSQDKEPAAIAVEQEDAELDTQLDNGREDDKEAKVKDDDLEANLGRDPRRDSLTPLQNRELSVLIQPVNVSQQDIGTGTLPEGADRENVMPRSALPTGYDRGATYKVANWHPSLICHYPLYFEDAMLERHGHIRFGCFQSLASGAKFFGTLPLMPYLYTLKPKHECQYALGHYRAGSCAPLVRDHLPWDKKAAVVEALAWSSFFWAAPL